MKKIEDVSTLARGSKKCPPISLSASSYC